MSFISLAQTFGWNPKHLQAVARVESSGIGFYSDGHPKLRFEPHHWNKNLRAYLDKINVGYMGFNEGEWSAKPEDEKMKLCRMTFTDNGKGFSSVAVETGRQAFEEAKNRQEDLAIYATSFGKYQIMGFNFKRCNCETLKQFYDRMFSEFLQDEMFAHFVNGDKRLRSFMQLEQTTLEACTAFAKAYNGSSNADAYGSKIYREAMKA